MVVDILEAAIGAEIPDEEAHRVARAGDLAVGPAAARMAGEQLGIGPADIGVGHDDIGADPLAARQTDAGGAAILDQDLLHLRIAAQMAALAVDEADDAIDQRAHAAHGVMHAMHPFQMRDQAVIGRRRHRIAADQQRMEAEGDA